MSFLSDELWKQVYLSKRAQDLRLIVLRQLQDLYASKGVIVPPVASVTLQLVARTEKPSVSDIAKILEVPHQTIAQRLGSLRKLNLVENGVDPNDQRRTIYQLTKLGAEQFKLLEECLQELAIVYSDMYDEIECDLPKFLSRAITALNDKSISERFEERFEK